MMTGPLSQRSTATVELLEHIPGRAAFLYCDSVVLLVWLDAADHVVMDRLGSAIGKLTPRNLPAVSVINWLTPNRPMPDADARRRLAQLGRTFQGDVSCVSVILNGDGFWAGAIRGAVNGISMLLPSQFELRVDHTLDDTLLWRPRAHHKLTGEPLSAQRVRYIVQTGVQTLHRATATDA